MHFFFFLHPKKFSERTSGSAVRTLKSVGRHITVLYDCVVASSEIIGLVSFMNACFCLAPWSGLVSADDGYGVQEK